MTRVTLRSEFYALFSRIQARSQKVTPLLFITFPKARKSLKKLVLAEA